MKRARKLAVLYLVSETEEIPVAVFPPGSVPEQMLNALAEEARARWGMGKARAVIRLLPLLCYQGVLYTVGDSSYPRVDTCGLQVKVTRLISLV